MTLGLRDVTTASYMLSQYDSDIVLRFTQAAIVTIPSDVTAPLPVGMQFAIESFVSSVTGVGEPGVFIRGTDRHVVGPLRTGVFVKMASNEWLMSVGEGGKSDGTVPLPPTMKTVTPGGGELTVTWDAPVDDGGHSILNYVLEYSQNQTTWLSYPTKYGPQDRSGTIEGLSKGVTYYVRGIAVNEKGPSDPSNVVSGVPTQPFNNAQGGDVTYYTEGSSKFKLHTFRGSGQFTVLQNAGLPWRILCVGSGGYGSSAGGGGGGVNSTMSASCTPGVYNCNVGGGNGGLTWIQNPAGANFFQATGGAQGAGGFGNYNEGGVPGGGRGGATYEFGPDGTGDYGRPGSTSAVSGVNTYYGGGGGGMCWNCLRGKCGPGGAGGGGRSAGIEIGGNGESGAPNSGGGGGGTQGGSGGGGAAGVIMFAYEVDPTKNYADEAPAERGTYSVGHVDPDTLQVAWVESVYDYPTLMLNGAGKQMIQVVSSSSNMAWVGAAYDPQTGLFEKPQYVVPESTGACVECGE